LSVFASSGAARLAYDVTGAGPDVFLLHAGVNDRRGWQHVVDRLAPRYRVVSYDFRGYGETEYEPEDGWTPVADALAVLDATGLQRPVVVGCSMGGETAIDLTLAHPERVAALLLIGPAVRGAPYPEPPALMERADAAYEAGDIDAAGRLEAWLWLDGPTAPEGRVSGPARELFLAMNDRALRAGNPGEQGDTPDAWPRLAEIAVPTQLLVGRLDTEWITVVDEQAAARIPGADLRWLDGVAHVPHLEGDPATLDAIAAFVGAHA
jgi:pimeloyl-ACP methyl ester carboxylesterase